MLDLYKISLSHVKDDISTAWSQLSRLKNNYVVLSQDVARDDSFDDAK